MIFLKSLRICLDDPWKIIERLFHLGKVIPTPLKRSINKNSLIFKDFKYGNQKTIWLDDPWYKKPQPTNTPSPGMNVWH